MPQDDSNLGCITGKEHGDCSAFPNNIKAVAFSADGKTLFSGHEKENTLRRWDVARRGPVGQFNSPITQVRKFSFSPDSREVLAPSVKDDFYLWEAQTGKPCPVVKMDADRLMTDWLVRSGQNNLLRCEGRIRSELRKDLHP